MAQIESSSGGRKTSLELNLVPFIDLMSVLITFLLITAVWTQVSMIQIGSSIYGRKTESTPPTITPSADVVLKLDVRPSGYVLTVAKDVYTIPLKSSAYDDNSLISRLQQVKQKYPDKIDGNIAMADDIPYERLIHAMDAYLKSGFSAISVLTGGPN